MTNHWKAIGMGVIGAVMFHKAVILVVKLLYKEVIGYMELLGEMT